MAIPTRETTVAQAIDAVLTAERDAALAVAASERETEAVLHAARESERRILEAARLRASRLHQRSQARLVIALGELEREARGAAPVLQSLEPLVERAARALARRLTTADHEPA